MRYIWKSEQRWRDSILMKVMGFIGLLGMLWASTFNITFALLLCWSSCIMFMAALKEKTNDRFEKIEEK